MSDTHQKTLEQRVKLLESAMAVVLRAMDDVAICGGDDDWHWCVFCGASLPVIDADHRPGCAYIAAKKLLEDWGEERGL